MSIEPSRIAIIGAGIAGLAAAQRLHQAGVPVTVFEKSRGPGGRAATRRTDNGHFDHGAQFFTIRDPGFRALLSEFEHALEPWDPVQVDNPDIVKTDRWWVGTPGMSSIARALTRDIDVVFNTHVTRIANDGEYRLFANGDCLGTYTSVIVSAPAPQSAQLVEPCAPDLAARIQNTVRIAPCWALMLAFDRPVNHRLNADAIRYSDHALDFIAHNSAKPGRPRGETWVVHASPTWTRAHLELESPDAAQRLWNVARTEWIDAPHPTHTVAHRWRYARVEAPLGTPFGRDSACSGLYVCGDWCIAGRVEGAFASGDAVSRQILLHDSPETT